MDYAGGPNLVIGALKSRDLSLAGVQRYRKKEKSETESLRGTWSTTAERGHMESMKKNCRQLKEQRVALG